MSVQARLWWYLSSVEAWDAWTWPVPLSLPSPLLEVDAHNLHDSIYETHE
jgi:hypothetical protein